MSQTRLHEILQSLFETRDQNLLNDCLEHSDYLVFMVQHGLKIPVREFVQAFTHTSFNHEYQAPHQEQLEFLGDSVLQLMLTDELYQRFPNEKEGKLSKIRSSLVNEKVLSEIGLNLELDKLILVGKGEFKKDLYRQAPVVADTFEALLGQIYRHQGFEFTKKLFLSWLKQFIPQAFESDFSDSFDAKSKLQEMSLARYKKLPRYTSDTSGDGFEVKLWINEELLAQGHFNSKKTGEKELALDVLKKGLI
jgi:ribonuclease-3